ncbi:MAG: baseplate protein J, partial [Chloroflexi bacterium]|nr:baseplate protein J [Chloroflexota bacterium]
MPIPLPNLDDRSYSDLVAEARAMIPMLYPMWRDHNPSDPGIALMEMLAWLTEMTLFQVNEITENHTAAFLAMLNGPDWSSASGGDVDSAVRQTILALRERYRAVTSHDFEHLLFHKWPQTEMAANLGEQNKIARICSLPQRNLEEGQDPTAEAPAHISLVILPQNSLAPSSDL